jgi:hypothetical protein
MIAYEHAQDSSAIGRTLRRAFRVVGLAHAYAPLREAVGRDKMHNPFLRVAFTGMVDFVLHEIYWLIASASHRLGRRPPPAPAIAGLVDPLTRSGYAVCSAREVAPEAVAALETGLWKEFDAFQERAPYGYRPKMPVLWKGMLCYPAVSENQVHFDAISREQCELVWEFLRATGCRAALEARLGCRLSGFNVRVWRYLPRERSSVGLHRDNLPPHAFKAMYFRGAVDELGGALKVRGYNGEESVVAGLDRIIIFDANRVYHESRNPAPGRHRDCIEVCLMPELSRSRRVQYSGFEAEHPYNPFRSWQEPARELVPLKPFGRPSGRLIAI